MASCVRLSGIPTVIDVQSATRGGALSPQPTKMLISLAYAGELVNFGPPVWYRFSLKIPGDWPRDIPAARRQLCRTVIHQIKQDSFKGGKSCDASPFFKIEARPLGERVRFFAQVATGTPCIAVSDLNL
jgi:hypothetical protein